MHFLLSFFLISYLQLQNSYNWLSWKSTYVLPKFPKKLPMYSIVLHKLYIHQGIWLFITVLNVSLLIKIHTNDTNTYLFLVWDDRGCSRCWRWGYSCCTCCRWLCYWEQHKVHSDCWEGCYSLHPTTHAGMFYLLPYFASPYFPMYTSYAFTTMNCILSSHLFSQLQAYNVLVYVKTYYVLNHGLNSNNSISCFNSNLTSFHVGKRRAHSTRRFPWNRSESQGNVLLHLFWYCQGGLLLTLQLLKTKNPRKKRHAIFLFISPRINQFVESCYAPYTS